MDSYVVRIYRRDPENPRKSVGVVERAEGEGEQAFHSLDELMSILQSQGSSPGASKVKKKRTR